MSTTVDTLLLDMLEWISREERPYHEVMDAWRTSCPRLAVWEEATDRNFVVRQHHDGIGQIVQLTEAGRAFLELHRAIASLPASCL